MKISKNKKGFFSIVVQAISLITILQIGSTQIENFWLEILNIFGITIFWLSTMLTAHIFRKK